MKVRDSVATPRHGWGYVGRSSVGTLRVLPPPGYETLVIDFPDHEAWSGLLSEVKVVPDDPSPPPPFQPPPSPPPPPSDEPDGVSDDPSDQVSSVEPAMAEPTSNPGRLSCVFEFISFAVDFFESH